MSTKRNNAHLLLKTPGAKAAYTQLGLCESLNKWPTFQRCIIQATGIQLPCRNCTVGTYPSSDSPRWSSCPSSLCMCSNLQVKELKPPGVSGITERGNWGTGAWRTCCSYWSQRSSHTGFSRSRPTEKVAKPHKDQSKSCQQGGWEWNDWQLQGTETPGFPSFFPPLQQLFSATWADIRNPHCWNLLPLVQPTVSLLLLEKKKAFLEESSSQLTDHGGAPSQRSLGPLEEVISRCHPLFRHLEAGVNINPSGNHHPAMGFDSFHPSWHNQILSYLPG